MLEKLRGVMIPLGHGKFILSDVIIAVEPLPVGYYGKHSGVKVRSRVLINHAEGEILASRTAETILKGMTKQEEVLPRFVDACQSIKNATQKVSNRYSVIHSDHIPNRSEIQMIIDALIHYSTVRDAIESLPFGETKYYKLVKQYGIDVKAYLESTDDPESYHEQHKDDGLA